MLSKQKQEYPMDRTSTDARLQVDIAYVNTLLSVETKWPMWRQHDCSCVRRFFGHFCGGPYFVPQLLHQLWREQSNDQSRYKLWN